ncbi:2-oxo-4-hydroxy-4-carboxy-5-ureidoimidazoline decarboxylase [Aquabacterium sp. A7-Y]|uniref:2-oxo-4-hydroxy-4-carboxy-5-ureidoimidazoline decarboxylase n=1 Tax=Aquabacterium sp. A7-Y TaxID=1349605 RepID=UPI00223E211A|nr:2-oxo-4-hydroxy-4-carboxy-5-ureidoimidazoline decarboxylase [Aquabacterium sp. A7-Y]MCW7541086.1 2-oxo-4-hydroxy-4-carboxy-5-ureidoimidazoline decarboxylase [Aquabacterium sp. A7-Y]
MLTLERLNAATPAEFTALLEGIYEHSPWIAAEAAPARPFRTLAQLKRALVEVVRGAGRERQLALIRAHPELAGKAAVAGELTAESTGEQARAGLTHCSREEFDTLQRLNTDYTLRFGWPFILAVRGPRGTGLSRRQIIETFERRLAGHPDFEFAECLRHIHRIAEIRLDERFDVVPALGNQVWDWAEQLAVHSDAAAAGQLTVTYLTPAHRACAAQLSAWMSESGFDAVHIDAVGNVVGVYHGAELTAKRLLTGSHYDTVRNGGKYDGRLGILVPMACVAALHRAGRRLPFGIEVVAFSEEEGQRYKAAFLSSETLIGQFDPAWLEQVDADGITMLEAMQQAGLEPAAAPTLARRPGDYLGFVEVHIEQGPVLDELDLPLGVVSSINGSVRLLCEVTGVASHAGTTPMDRRRDAAAGVAELLLYVERRAAQDGDSVGTVGMLQVPNGSMNVVPGRCSFSLDLRAPTDAQRDRLAADVLAELAAICERRGLRWQAEETMRAAAAPSDPHWQARWERAVAALGLPVFTLPSGAGHDAMVMHQVMPQAMLFLRGGNAGISHNPLETISNDDAQLCVSAFQQLLEQLAEETR